MNTSAQRRVVANDRERRGKQSGDGEIEEGHQRSLPESEHLQIRPAREELQVAAIHLFDHPLHAAFFQPSVRVEEQNQIAVRGRSRLRAGEILSAPSAVESDRLYRPDTVSFARIPAYDSGRAVDGVIVVNQYLLNRISLFQRRLQTGGQIQLLVPSRY
jgi:hypothetical protein